jgi:hypothetical protein
MPKEKVGNPVGAFKGRINNKTWRSLEPVCGNRGESGQTFGKVLQHSVDVNHNLPGRMFAHKDSVCIIKL